MVETCKIKIKKIFTKKHTHFCLKDKDEMIRLYNMHNSDVIRLKVSQREKQENNYDTTCDSNGTLERNFNYNYCNHNHN